jgi:hypothetical protein
MRELEIITDEKIHDLSVVIPVYNEEENVSPLY